MTPIEEEDLPRLAMSCAHGPPDQGMTEDELEGVSELRGRQVQGVRMRARPRSKLCDHKNHEDRNRLTVMLDEEGCVSMKDEAVRTGIGNNGKAWVSSNTTKPTCEQTIDLCFFDTPSTLNMTQVRFEEHNWHTESKQTLDKTDAHEWHQWPWIQLVRTAAEEREKKFPKSELFPLPLRFF